MTKVKLDDLPQTLKFIASYIFLKDKEACGYVFQSSHKKYYEIEIDGYRIDIERVNVPSAWMSSIKINRITFFIIDKNVILKIMKPSNFIEISYYQMIKGEHKLEINKMDKSINLTKIQENCWGEYYLTKNTIYDKEYILRILGIEKYRK